MSRKRLIRFSQNALSVLLTISLLFLLAAGQPSYADSGVPSHNTIRIGIFFGVQSLPSARIAYPGEVSFRTENIFGEVIELARDFGPGWSIRREAVSLAVGPYGSQWLAEQNISRWPASLGPAFVSRDSEGYFIVGGVYVSVEQAAAGLSQLVPAGLSNARVRGAHHLRSVTSYSREEAEQLALLLQASGVHSARVLYDGSFRLAAGYATDLFGLTSLEQQIRGLLPHVTMQAFAPDFRRIDVVKNDGRTILTYDNMPNMPLRAAALDAGILSVEGRQHRGIYEFLLTSDLRFNVISIMAVEDYLKAVVPREMPSLWHIEALKAQAVVARTYTQASRGKHAAAGFDLCTFSTCCQAYGGVDWEHANSSAAVEATQGVMLFAAGRPAATFYHSDSGGHTEYNHYVWNGNPISYLIGVPDPFPSMAGSPHATWTTALSPVELGRILSSSSVNVGTISRLEVAERTPGGRVALLVVHGSLGRAELVRQQPRLPNGSPSTYELRSTMYSVTNEVANAIHIYNGQATHTQKTWDGLYVQNASGTLALPVASSYTLQGNSAPVSVSAQAVSFVFDGSGWGHGVGMSQWGARGMAEQGYTYQNILLHYYQGVELVHIAP